jgi:hypothetical protein
MAKRPKPKEAETKQVLPIPKKGEAKQAFINRFMRDPAAIAERPKRVQREQLALAIWAEANREPPAPSPEI